MRSHIEHPKLFHSALRDTARAATSAGVAFVLVLWTLRLTHPLLLIRHPGEVLLRCAVGALATFLAGVLIFHVKRNRV
jgi:hypothetical protein